MNRAIVGCVSSIMSGPSPEGFVDVSISNLGAGIVIKEPSGLISDHLVVIIVEELGSS